ncbi:MAG: hypothetical protein ACM336_09565 [Acidobacteriota bacterium]
MKKHWPWFQDTLLAAVFLAIVSLQLFIPPYIGLADNGDFPKIAGRLSLGPADPGSRFDYFNADYIRSPRFRWQSDLRSSELWPAKLASYLSHTKPEGSIFNIRWLGAVHAVAFLAAFCILLAAARPMRAWARALLCGAVVWIFTDVSYVSCLNSFYMDAAALLGLLGCAAVAVLIVVKGPRIALLVPFMLFAILLIGSKAQHAPIGILLAVFVVVAAWKGKRLYIRLAGAAAGALLVAATAISFALTPASYRSLATFNVIFLKLAKNSPEPARELKELGLSEKELPYIGKWAFRPDVPRVRSPWFQDFRRRTGLSKLALYYLHHPVKVLRIMDADLREFAPYLRGNFANLRRQDATRPVELTRRFASWSDLKSRALFAWHGLLPFWYALVAAGVILVIRARPSERAVQMAWITAGLAAAGAYEFLVCSLADACETYRHLFLFHALTDLTFCMALAALLTIKPGTVYSNPNCGGAERPDLSILSRV